MRSLPEAAEHGVIGVVCPILSLAPVLLPNALSSSSTEAIVVAKMGQLTDIFAERMLSAPLGGMTNGGAILFPADVRVAHRFVWTAQARIPSQEGANSRRVDCVAIILPVVPRQRG